MALKDWKAIPKYNLWENKKNIRLRVGIVYNVVYVSDSSSGIDKNVIKPKKFSSKSQALKYAKAYMRKH